MQSLISFFSNFFTTQNEIQSTETNPHYTWLTTIPKITAFSNQMGVETEWRLYHNNTLRSQIIRDTKQANKIAQLMSQALNIQIDIHTYQDPNGAMLYQNIHLLMPALDNYEKTTGPLNPVRVSDPYHPLNTIPKITEFTKQLGFDVEWEPTLDNRQLYSQVYETDEEAQKIIPAVAEKIGITITSFYYKDKSVRGTRLQIADIPALMHALDK